jgi:hypothetical protein
LRRVDEVGRTLTNVPLVNSALFFGRLPKSSRSKQPSSCVETLPVKKEPLRAARQKNIDLI